MKNERQSNLYSSVPIYYYVVPAVTLGCNRQDHKIHEARRARSLIVDSALVSCIVVLLSWVDMSSIHCGFGAMRVIHLSMKSQFTKTAFRSTSLLRNLSSLSNITRCTSLYWSVRLAVWRGAWIAVALESRTAHSSVSDSVAPSQKSADYADHQGLKIYLSVVLWSRAHSLCHRSQPQPWTLGLIKSLHKTQGDQLIEV